jgi:hypothetical protein
VKKNQLKSKEKGEGPKSTMSASDPSAGSVDSNISMGKDYKADALHTASWQKGATLTVKREG